MTRQCTTCSDPATNGRLCAFCARFGVSRSAAPNAVIRRRVMRELDIERGRAELWITIADSARAEARWWKRCAGALGVAFIAALALALMSLNALPSASAYGATAGETRSRAVAVDGRTARELRRRCPSYRVMPRHHCIAWMRVAQCETGGGQWSVTWRTMRQIRWRYNGASGFDGGLQFSPRTWRGNIGRVPSRRLTRAQWVARERGAYSYAYRATAAVQILAADALRTRVPGGGLGHWPSCGARW